MTWGAPPCKGLVSHNSECVMFEVYWDTFATCGESKGLLRLFHYPYFHDPENSQPVVRLLISLLFFHLLHLSKMVSTATSHTPRKITMEPENLPFEKEIHLPNLLCSVAQVGPE